MGAPKFNPADLPCLTQGLATQTQGQATLYGVSVANETHWLSLVSMGNPHAVQIVADVDAAPVLVEGAQLEVHEIFPKKANIGFMQIINPHHIKVRIFERGAGETLACGTGACAAVVAGIERGVLRSPVRVSARGGELHIAWEGAQSDVLMTGPAVTVFEGQIDLPAPQNKMQQKQ
jgi:diaminopimelate epimerase